jgi:uncharacterized surface protein with fasciclin (FAS1) repeats
VLPSSWKGNLRRLKLTYLHITVESLGSIDDLKDFNEIIKKSGETDLLNRPHPFTVFAPKGEILGKFSDIEKSYLLSREGRKDLASIIERHIHDGAIYSKQLFDGKESLTSLQGEKLVIEVKDKDNLYVDGNQVTEKDFLAANGKSRPRVAIIIRCL